MYIWTLTFLAIGLLKMGPNSMLLMFSFVTLALGLQSSASFPLYSMTSWMAMDSFSFFMQIMVMVILILVNQSFNYFNTPQLFRSVIISNLVILILSLSSALNFYIVFELTIIPIFLMITTGGYQPERLSSSNALLFYTVTCSTPLLFAILWMGLEFSCHNFCGLPNFTYLNTKVNTIISLIVTMAFLVKFPMFMTHLWLPKAHVEAPVQGSMILAAVLLKLGGLGLIRVMSLIPMSDSAMKFIFSVSMWGMLMVSCLCARLVDIKAIIAYSSVAHMALSIITIIIQSKTSLSSSVIMMIAHAFSSSGLFFTCFLIYGMFNTRSLVITKGVLGMAPWVSLMWAMLILANLGTPPFMNLLAEIMCIISIINSNPNLMLIIFMSVMFSSAYSFIMYSSTSQSQKSWEISSNSSQNAKSISISLNHVALAILGTAMVWMVHY